MRNAKRFAPLLVGTFTLPLLTALPAKGDPPPPSGITIELVFGSRGCPSGTASGSIDENGNFTVVLDDLTASVGGDSSPAAARKLCQMLMKVHLPSNYTYGIRGIDQRGSARLQAGASGQVTQSHYFQGMAPGTTFTHTLNGPYDQNWQFRDTTEPGAQVYKPCGEQRSLLLSTELKANLGTSDPSKVSLISLTDWPGASSVQRAFAGGRTTYYFAWKTCSS